MNIQSFRWISTIAILEPVIRSLFHKSIVVGMLKTHYRCSKLGNTPQEPDFVASLTLDTTPAIAEDVGRFVGKAGFSFNISSVFCHQKPIVKFVGDDKTNKACELGDILFVHLHRENGTVVHRNALLFQAKVSASQPCYIDSAGSAQLDLYSNRPVFTYSRGPFNGQERQIECDNRWKKDVCYMQIDPSEPFERKSGLSGMSDTFPIGSCLPCNKLEIDTDLANELIFFLIAKSGRPFDDYDVAQKTIGWSRVVWDLLEGAKSAKFRRKNAGISDAPRGPKDLSVAWDGVSVTSSRPSTNGGSSFLNDIPPNRDGTHENDFHGGVSLVMFESASTAEFREREFR
ncbi:MAG: hypothetical protein HW380_1281 [Magnetococcales bacterium]|nr:hypothetical protein [Magnetococcales bacterium]HIJ85126.1 hypothetical protein [Magnetococcales bacterium]